MADNTKIEWTDATWNPITGCSVVSPGCTNCYAMKLAGTRLKNHPTRSGLTIDSKAGPVWNGQVRFNESMLLDPLRWKRPRMIFVCAHGDLFAENVPDEWIDQVFAVMTLAPHHTFQVLTKRPERMRDYLLSRNGMGNTTLCEAINAIPANLGNRKGALEMPMPNVWLGVSVEDQKRADERIPILLDTPAALRWISAEPLLGQINLFSQLGGTLWIGGQRGCGGRHSHPGRAGENIHGVVHNTDPNRLHHHHDERCNPGIDWVVAGGESGHDARPMHPAWARSLRDQCAVTRTPFLFKQWGNWLGGEWQDDGDSGWFQPASAPHHPRIPFRQRHRDEHWFEDAKWPEGPGAVRMSKKYTGRELDGIEHNGFPDRLV